MRTKMSVQFTLKLKEWPPLMLQQSYVCINRQLQETYWKQLGAKHLVMDNLLQLITLLRFYSALSSKIVSGAKRDKNPSDKLRHRTSFTGMNGQVLNVCEVQDKKRIDLFLSDAFLGIMSRSTSFTIIITDLFTSEKQHTSSSSSPFFSSSLWS